jgi:CBS domain-containing protein
MLLSKIGSRSVATAEPRATVLEAARRMEEKNVGAIVVVRDRTPVGILTDRDVLLRVVNRRLDPNGVRVEDVMTKDLVTVGEDAEPIDAAARMRERHVRRLPIVGARGELVGIVTLDDIVYHVGRTSGEASEVIASYPEPYQGG